MPKTVTLLLLGEIKSGKTALRARFISGKKPDSSYQQTVGANFLSKDLSLDNDLWTLKISDMPGDPVFAANNKPELNHAGALLLLVTPKQNETLENFSARVRHNIEDNRESIAAQCGDNYKVDFVLVLSKTDQLPDNLSKETLVAKLQDIAQQKQLHKQVFAVSANDSTEDEIAAPFIAAAKLASEQVQDLAFKPPHVDIDNPSEKKHLIPWMLQKILSFANHLLGLIFGMVLGMISLTLYCNPITVFYTLVRGLASLYSDKNTPTSIAVLATLFSPLLVVGVSLVLAPLLGLMIGANEGLEKGFLEGISMPWRLLVTLTSKDHQEDPKQKPMLPSAVLVHPADIVIGILLSLVVTGVVLGILFPPSWFGIATLLSTAIATLGLTGIDMGLIAAAAGVASFSVVSLAYAAGFSLVSWLIGPSVSSYTPIHPDSHPISSAESYSLTAKQLPPGRPLPQPVSSTTNEVHAAPPSPLHAAVSKQITGDQTVATAAGSVYNLNH